MKEITLLSQEIESIEKKYNKDIKYFSPNHNLELYFYEYYINQDEYVLCEDRIHQMYKELGDRLLKYNLKDKAEEAYLKAIEYNPVDLDIYYALCNFYVNEEKLDKLLIAASKIYNFCYTKLDMARYYYYLGQYFKLGYEADLAYILFSYSRTMFETNENKTELEFLLKAINRPINVYTEKQLQELLIKNKIPVMPNEVTLAIVYKMAELEMSKGNTRVADELSSILKQFI